jgi:hypothetical protein
MYIGTPWHEDCHETTFNKEHLLDGFVRQESLSVKLSDWVRFRFVVEEYTKRRLSHDGDALNAVAGVLNRLSAQMKTQMVQGLPAYYFDRALLFYWNSHWPNDGASRRRHGFPSYSWAGWREVVYYNPFDTDSDEIGHWERDHAWICWYQVPQFEGQFAMPIGIVDTPPNTKRNYFRDFTQFSPEDLAFMPTLEKRAFVSAASPSRRYPLLNFWTLVVYFRPQFDVEDKLSCISSKYRLTDEGGMIVGEVQLRCDLSLITCGLPLELLLLSEGIKNSSDFKLPERYFVMAVHLVDGIAERIGLGWIKKEL